MQSLHGIVQALRRGLREGVSFAIAQPFTLLAEPPDAGPIALSCFGIERSTIEAVIGKPQWNQDPPSVPTSSGYWGLKVGGYEVLLEHTDLLLGVYCRERSPQVLCPLLGLDPSSVATYALPSST